MEGQRDLSLASATLLAAVLALTSHARFNKGPEPNAAVFAAALLLGTVGLAGYWASSGVSLRCAISEALITLGAYIATISTSVILYRHSPYHPLAAIPGPRLARTTQMWWAYQVWKSTPRLALLKAHRKYGSFVRLGPNEISVNEVECMSLIHGAKGMCKTTRYKHGLLTSYENTEDGNLLALQTHAEHAGRRRVWDKAFSSTSLLQYHPLLENRTAELVGRLAESKGGPTDLHQWSGYFVYDVASDVAFGGGFGMLSAGRDPHGMLPVIVRANAAHALCESLPWIKPFMGVLPTGAAIRRVFAASRAKFEERAAKGATAGIQDIFYFLSGEGDAGSKLPHETLAKEAQLVVGAGADTTRTALTAAILFLIQHQQIYSRLQAEMDDILAHGSISPAVLEKAPLLNAVVNETLRLSPPVTIGVVRESNGLALCGRFIPTGTVVRTPTYVMHRDERFFSPGPDEFRPERWIKPKEETAMNTAAFVPFIVGPFACVGRALALQELRMAIASIAATFDATFAPEFDVDKFQSRVTDRFLMEFTDPVMICLRKRKDVDHGIAEGALHPK